MWGSVSVLTMGGFLPTHRDGLVLRSFQVADRSPEVDGSVPQNLRA